MRYPCGCVNMKDLDCGVVKCIKKCTRHYHSAQNQATGKAYYLGLGAINDREEPIWRHYIQQLDEALGPIIPAPFENALALEIGSGASPYVQNILDVGYRYQAIDPDPWVKKWMAATYKVPVQTGFFPFPGMYNRNTFRLVLAAHSLEHIKEMPEAVHEVQRILQHGGYFYIVVPDDQDPINRDHWWFFTTTTLRRLLIASGFRVIKLEERRIVPKEKFIYCLAQK